MYSWLMCLYFTISVPLTIVVVAIWYLYSVPSRCYKIIDYFKGLRLYFPWRRGRELGNTGTNDSAASSATDLESHNQANNNSTDLSNSTEVEDTGLSAVEKVSS